MKTLLLIVIAFTAQAQFIDFSKVKLTQSKSKTGYLFDPLNLGLNVSQCYINNAGSNKFAKDTIINNELVATLFSDDPAIPSGLTRCQMTLNFNKPASEYHSSHQMIFNNDFNYLQQYPKNIGPFGVPDWLTIAEFWNQSSPDVTWQKSEGAGSMRWTLSLCKTGNSPFFWRLTCEQRQPSIKQLWTYTSNIEVPIGKYFTLDLYMRRGEGTNGNFTVIITQNGLSMVLLNVNNTTAYPGHPELILTSWQPFKLYTSQPVMDWMRGKKLQVKYSNFNFYQN